MENWLITRLLKWFGNKFDGYKTYAGSAGKAVVGAGAIVTGLLGLAGIAFPGQGLPEMDVEQAMGVIAGGFDAMSSGLATAGLGHKADKAADAAVVQASVVKAEINAK